MMRLTILSLLAGSIQMAVGYWLNIHRGLEHTQYGQNYWLYVGETAFYAFWWFFFLVWFRDKMRENAGRERWNACASDPDSAIEKNVAGIPGPRSHYRTHLGL